MIAKKLKFSIEPLILKMIKLSDMFLVLMRNGVPCLVFPAQMEEKPSMAVSSFISLKVGNNNFWKVMLVLLEEPISIMKLINPTSSALLKEKPMRKTPPFILLKFLLHHKVFKNSKNPQQLSMTVKLQMISQLL